MEQIVESRFLLLDIQGSYSKNLLVLTLAFAFEHHNEMMTAMCTVKSNLALTLMEDAIAEQLGRNVVKEGFKLIILDGCDRYGAVRQGKAEDGHEWTDRPLCMSELICRDVQAIGQIEATKLSRMTNTSVAIVHMN